MTREEAIRILASSCIPGSKQTEALETLIPELKESEDERIRKAIVATIEQCPDDFLNPKNRDRMLSYLEKQKVTPMPNSTELIEMWHKVKAILKEKDFRGDEWRLAQNAFMDGFARGTCVKSEKQKEQKPAEWSEEDEKKIHFLSRLIEFQVKDGEYCFGEGACAISKQEAIEMLQSLRPSWKPSDVCYGAKGDPDPAGVWKPSEEQMGALNYAYCELFKRGDVRHNILGPLQKLCDELKKLM